MNIQLIIFIVFVAISVFQSIIKKANEQAEQQKQRAQRGKAAPQNKAQSEIEAFLAEVTGESHQPPAPKKKRTRRSRPSAENKKKQRRPQEPKTSKRSPARTRQTVSSHSQSGRPGERKIGSGIGQHVDQYINQHVSQHIDNDVEEYVEATIVDNVNSNLGDRSVEMPTATGTTSKESNASRQVRELLQNPDGIRNAIVLNEILSKPRALR